MSNIRAWLDRLDSLRSFMSEKHRLVGLSLLRVGLGTIILAYFVDHIAQRAFLWGNNGAFPYTSFAKAMHVQRNFLSLYLISQSPILEVAIFYGGVLVTILFILGYKTRIASILFYVFTWSIYGRNPFVIDGGDNLLYLLAFYMMFTDCGACFSLDAWLRPDEGKQESPYVALVHNFGVAAIIAQLCILYFTSAFFKMQGHMWQDGTAIYYILRSAEFNLSPSAHLFWDSDAVVTLLTWSTMIFQMSWPFLIFQRRARPLLVAGAILMHTMIAYFMGLFWFSAVLICAELIVFDDLDYARFAEGLRRIKGRIWGQVRFVPVPALQTEGRTPCNDTVVLREADSV